MVLNMLFDNYDLLMDSPNSTVKMRKLILQLAVQGKLVDQDSNDEPASELLKRIKAEKEKLIAGGKIKKQKPLPSVTEDEIPYELPQGWEWVRLGELGETNPRINVDNDEMDVSFIPMKMISKKYGERHSSERKKWAEVKKGFTYFMDNDVGLAKITPCFENGKSTVFKGLLNGVGAGTTELHIFRQDPKLILPEYVLIFFKYPKFLNDAKEKMTGTAGQKRVPQDFVRLVPFPLPSISEQKRIVAKVDQLMQLCDQLDACQEKTSTKHTSLNDAALEKLLSAKTIDEFANHWQFICNNFDLIYNDPAHVNKLRRAILQLAVQGKLAPQNPNDEPASELLKRIKAEKEKLIAEGKIKKQKPLPGISEDENPFEIPEEWEWARLQTLVSLLGDGLHGTPNYTPGTKYYFVNGNNLNNGKIEIKPSTKTVSYEEMHKYKKDLSSNAVLVSINGTLGNVAFYNGEKIILGKSACYFNLSEYVSKHFIKIVLESPDFMSYALRNATGSTIKNLSLKAMNGLPVPLPPFVEQHRIVAKVDQLMHLCDELETRLNQSKKDSEMLMQAVLHEAFF